MKLPDWVKPEVAPAMLWADPETGQINVPDSIHTAPGWRLWGEPIYTCVPPPDGPFVDRVALRELHVFDPGAIPMWEIQGYLPPNSRVPIYTRRIHIARHLRDPNEVPPQRLKVHMPTHCRHPTPNYLDYASFEDDHPQGGPSTHIPADGRLVRHLRKTYAANKAVALERFDAKVEALIAKLEKEYQNAQEEHEYIRKQLWKLIGPTVSSWTDKDWAGYQAWIRRRMAARRRLGVNPASSVHVRSH